MMNDNSDERYKAAMEAIEKMKAEYEAKKRAAAVAQEERRQWYESTGKLLLSLPVKVLLTTGIPPDKYRGFIGGNIRREGEGFLMRIDPTFGLEIERSTFCHELGHALAGHGMPASDEEAKGGDVTREVFRDGHLDTVAGVKVNASKMYRDMEAEEERQADEYGERLFKMLWPRERFVPCGTLV